MLKDWLKTDVTRQLVTLHVNLLIQKTTADNDDKPTYIQGGPAKVRPTYIFDGNI